MVEDTIRDKSTASNSRNRQSFSTPPGFRCLRCGTCCQKYQPRLSAGESARLAAALGISAEQFLERFTDHRWPGTQSFLLSQKDGACIFLTRSRGQSLCGIHPIKPQCCRDWVPDILKPECQAGLEKRFRLTVDAQGRLQGQARDRAKFKKYSEGQKNKRSRT